jgi:hypothetical protein
MYHSDVAAVAELDVGEILAWRWEHKTAPDGDPDADAWIAGLHLSAVLRSWEDRFGARLLQIGPAAKIRLLVSRPPRTEDAALAVAGELWAFGDMTWVTHSSQEQVESVAEIACLIIDQPIWGFWWD